MNKEIPDLQIIDGITYQLNSDIPYTGKYIMIFDNGDKSEGNYVNGKLTDKEAYREGILIGELV
jgi:hypothetical protein